MKNFLMGLCLLAACGSPAKTLKLQQEFVRIADASTVSWLAKKNAGCIDVASKQAEQKEGMDIYATCTLDLFETATKISNLIDAIRSNFKVEAGTLLAIARGEVSKDMLKGITPELTAQLSQLTLLLGGLK